MSESLHRLVYFSQNTLLGSHEEIVEEIEQILASSRANNVTAGVTGALMFNRGCFAQVLEGTLAKVSETFERIQCDPRHSEVVVLGFGPVAARSFGHWSMAFVGQARQDRETYGRIAEVSHFDPANLKADDLFDTLHRLVMEEERRAAA